MRVAKIFLLVFGTIAAIGCGTHRDDIEPSPTPSASALPLVSALPSVSALPAASGQATFTASVTAAPSGTPAPATAGPSATPVVTPNPNLLTYARGTFMRRWSVRAGSPGALMVGLTWTIDPAFAGTPEIVYELPAPAAIDSISVSLVDAGDPAARVHVDAATASPAGFTEAGVIAGSPSSAASAGTLAGPIRARWLRLRFERKVGTAATVSAVAASGTMGGSNLPLAGKWTLADDAGGGSDRFFANAAGVVAPDDRPVAFEREAETFDRSGTFDGGFCNVGRPFWHGRVAGGAADLGSSGSLQVVGGGALLAGSIDGGPFLARRISRAPACDLAASGRGRGLLFIEQTPTAGKAETGPVAGRAVRTVFAAGLSAADLAADDTAVLDEVCNADSDLAPDQKSALLDYVSNGHVLIVRDADVCAKSGYTFLPFPFTTAASGENGAKSDRLYVADSSILGSDERSDQAHFVDAAAYIANSQQQIGDADVMQTNDPHWCGLMFARNVRGDDGWVHAYARYGRGIIVYNGFDSDDVQAKIPQALTIARLDAQLSPRSELPCSALVAGGLLVLSSTSRMVPFGKAQTLDVPFDVEQSLPRGTRRVALSLESASARGFSARLDPSAFSVGSGPQRVHLTVRVPGNVSAATYLFTVSARDEAGENAHAALTIVVNEALAKALETGGRARIYGIHFEVASASIQPQSEATIREIAGVLRSHASWRMRVEGYTDSDGGVGYNRTLSVARARAVVSDLQHRFGIAAPRLAAAGFGETRPVASNATSAGKALNRRVELARF
jgi:outer membrane protein OmpA-like peptidoglycan-associated protein